MSEESIQVGLTPLQKSAAIWGCVAFGIAILSVTRNTSAMVLGAGFFAKFFAVIVGTGLGTLGALLGDGIRRFAMPDGIITSGGMGTIIQSKLFWMIGPQTIGLLIGVFFGAALVLG
jgi:hypothetical protein